MELERGRKESLMAAVTRRDLARALKEELGGSITDHDRWIQAFVSTLSRKVAESGRVEIRGFRSFKLNTIKAHETVRPADKSKKKKKRVKIPESYTVDFRPSKLYKDQIKAEQTKKRKQAASKKKEATPE